MTAAKLSNMSRGWFIGSFIPSVFPTSHCEVAVKEYKAGEREAKHHHKIATEITVIIDGTVTMNGETFVEGDIITVSPGESVEFAAVTDAKNVVVKIPSVIGDKYLD